jgi:hypothetical protein
VEEIHKADAFDYVLLKSFQEYKPTSEYTAKIRHVQRMTDDQETLGTSSVTFQAPVELLTKPRALCSFRTTTHIGPFVNLLWGNGEYFLRDPDKLRQNSPLQPLFDPVENRQQERQSRFTVTNSPCIHTSNLEDACLGAHLYQPVVQAMCARFLVTDLPGTVRAALLASRQMAPTTVYPLESTPVHSDSLYHRLPPLPTCLPLE